MSCLFSPIQLFVLNFYPFLQRYLQPHQKGMCVHRLHYDLYSTSYMYVHVVQENSILCTVPLTSNQMCVTCMYHIVHVCCMCTLLHAIQLYVYLRCVQNILQYGSSTHYNHYALYPPPSQICINGICALHVHIYVCMLQVCHMHVAHVY